MARVVLLYDRHCPNVPAARANLTRAFAETGLPPRWDEVDQAAADTPAAWRGYGSPSVLVDGRDVAGLVPAGEGATCRLYDIGGARQGAPPVALLVAALAASVGHTGDAPSARAPAGRHGRLLLAVPGIGMALLPNVACPACWPAYAGLLSSVGLGFLLETRYLLPLTAGFLGITLASMAWRADRRRGLGPLLLGATAAVALLLGKFVYEVEAATWVGVGLLVAASVWNSWPRTSAAAPSEACPSCAPNSGGGPRLGEP